MQQINISYPEANEKLKTLLTLSKTHHKQHEVGTGFLKAGTRMPDAGKSAHARHEVSIIVDGMLKTSSGGQTVLLQAGDIVSIPELQEQSTEVVEDTRLIYIFFDK
ncbi:hypothetical protein HBA55_21395 [Pseudomaricurvus alkylphenolicus]|jgi:ethanolamine utilization protein EutQ (cupin superfamily)|uniref:hypothetical protein n=1 Tax=Pseudomaricurvus alkylphenolicus TaxID=1306991 RepID=UPI0014234E69|nr:hypothetical protein [Pseudomaricurvus alkylphenolicus]NIB42176.1 hypothetical protein [Pseudomaricurvus alkylphenolicus]